MSARDLRPLMLPRDTTTGGGVQQRSPRYTAALHHARARVRVPGWLWSSEKGEEVGKNMRKIRDRGEK